MRNQIVAEAERLNELGFSIMWLYPKSKRPKESGWTSGPRKEWSELIKTYCEGDNLGVRLGESSKIGNNYLACIDVDIKDPLSKPMAQGKLTRLLVTLGIKEMPTVESGSGGGSKHLYFVTSEPFKMVTVAKEKDKFEIVIYSSGRQMVLSPSVHPNGKLYRWRHPINQPNDLPIVQMDLLNNLVPEQKISQEVEKSTINSKASTFAFEVQNVDLSKLKLHNTIRGMLATGVGVTDRSAALLPVSSALLRAGLSRDEILSVLTDKQYFLGTVAYEHAQSENRIRAASWLFKYTVKKVITESADWEANLDFTEKGNYRTTLKNVVDILQNKISFEIFKRDVFSYRDFYSLDTEWGGKKDAQVNDEDPIKIKHWLSSNYGIEPSIQTIGEGITIIAEKNIFDPIVLWLENLPTWDSVERLDTWLFQNFEAKGDSEYLAQVFRKWVCAMIIRIFDPGAKFDWLPIFEGPQGVGKSSFGRMLVGDKYFLDWLPNFADKDSAIALQGIWAVELNELSSLRQNEINLVKGFVARTIDKFRPPYARRSIESPRRCVFFGTTNQEQYLKDETGNRRFKPVKVGNLNFDRLKQDRLQLFAEALYLVKTGFENSSTLELDGEAKIYEAKIHKEKMVLNDSDLMREKLIKFFNEEKLKSDSDRLLNLSKFQIEELFEGNLQSPPLKNWKYESKNITFSARALKRLGGKKWKSNGLSYWDMISDIGE